MAEVPLHILEERGAADVVMDLQILGAHEVERLRCVERGALQVIAPQSPIDLLPLLELLHVIPTRLHDLDETSVQHASLLPR